jgi:hypothetical protein
LISKQLLDIASNWRQRLSTESEARGTLGELIKQVQLTETGLRVTVNIPAGSVGAGPRDAISLSHFAPMTIRPRGVGLHLILNGRTDERRQIDSVLLKALARARSWFEEVASGRVFAGRGRAPRGDAQALRRAF